MATAPSGRPRADSNSKVNETMWRKLSEREKQHIIDMFHETESATLTAAVWDIEPAEVVAIAFLADQPDRKPPCRAGGESVRDALRKKLFVVARATERAA